MTPPLVDQELVVHLFAPREGPRAAEAYRQVGRVWTACRERLGMTEPIAGLPVRLPETLPADGVVAARETRAGDRQAVLRRVHDVLNLSVAFAQPAPEGLRPRAGSLIPVQDAQLAGQRRLGWAEFAQIWDRASMAATAAMLGEARLFLARMPPGETGSVAATAELGRSLDLLLPYREDRPPGWWQWGTTTAAGYALWDTRLAADTGAVREIVLIGAADSDAELSAWAWSNGTPDIPPFARYLMHAAKLRFEARLLDDWHRPSPVGREIAIAGAELSAAQSADVPGRVNAELLRAKLGRLRVKEDRLKKVEADLRRMQRTVEMAYGNLRQGAGRDADDAAGMFRADQDLARWLARQLEGDVDYLRIDLDGAGHARALAVEELGAIGGPASAPAGSPTRAADDHGQSSPARQPAMADRAGVTRRVFVVHGRDSALATRFFDLLNEVRLEPMEWEKLVAATASTAPYLGQVVARAPHLAHATLVLLSPDDIVELHSDLFHGNDQPYERARAGQARPNVLFELGMALGAYPDRTVVVEVGQMRPVADIVGLNVIRFDGSAVAIKKVLDRLKLAGCPVDDSGTGWLDTGRFADLATYRRGPGTHQATGS